MSTVDILIPAYNVEAYLKECLDSVLAQTFSDWECYVMDDGSQDATYAVACDYAKKDARIHALHQENKGNVDALNALLEHAKAEYVMMLDSDDCICPQTLEFCIHQLRETKADIAEFCITRAPASFKASELPTFQEAPSIQVLTDLSCYQTRSTAVGSWINKCNKLYRLSAIAGLRFDSQLCYEEDFWFNVLAHMACKSKVILQTALYYYRTTPQSLTRKIRFVPYVTCGIRRIWLSHQFFIEQKHLSEPYRKAYEIDITRDAFRMILQKNLKKNWNLKQSHELFQLAADNLEKMVAQGAIWPRTLSARKRWALWAATHHAYILCRFLTLLASI